MTRGGWDQDNRIEAFAEVVRQLPPALSTRQRNAGWLRLAQGLASRRAPAHDEARARWWHGRVSTLGLSLALAAALVVVPAAWWAVKRSAPRPLDFVVNGEVVEAAAVGTAAGSGSGRAATGRVVSAPKGRAQLLFTDGSRIGMHAASRLSVAALGTNGSNIQLLDGTIDVDVRHQPSTSWTFEAGPYVVHVVGTSFALGWDAPARRLALSMRSGAVTLEGAPGTSPRKVEGGESLLLDAAPAIGESPAPPPELGPARAAPSPPTGGVPSAVPSTRAREAPSALGAYRDRKAADRRVARLALAHLDWAPLLARGDFDAIVEQAKQSGVDACLAADTASNLAALADAARYTHHADLARQSLLSLRARFPATDRAQDAAFFLARLSEGRSANEALSWYERYLGEAAGGSYAEEALGREMILLGKSEEHVRARSVAERYLGAYPHGIYAHAAALLLGNPSAP